MSKPPLNRLLCLVILAFALGVSATPLPAVGQQAESAKEEIVSYNMKSHKFHCRTCTWAKRCTVNCVGCRSAKPSEGEE
jgi:hypothetical protein